MKPALGDRLMLTDKFLSYDIIPTLGERLMFAKKFLSYDIIINEIINCFKCIFI